MKVVRRLLLGVSLLTLVSGCTSLNRWFDSLGENKVENKTTSKQTVANNKNPEDKKPEDKKPEEKKPSHHQAAEKKSPSKKDMEKKAFNSQFSGWLVDYTDMKENKTASGGTSLLWVSPDLKKGKYTAIMIDPIGLYPRPPLLAKVSKGRMLEALTYIKTRATNQIGSTLKIVDKPGPGVLRLDAAITGVKTSAEKNSRNDAKNIPVAMIFADMSPAASQPEQQRHRLAQQHNGNRCAQKRRRRKIRPGARRPQAAQGQDKKHQAHTIA